MSKSAYFGAVLTVSALVAGCGGPSAYDAGYQAGESRAEATQDIEAQYGQYDGEDTMCGLAWATEGNAEFDASGQSEYVRGCTDAINASDPNAVPVPSQDANASSEDILRAQFMSVWDTLDSSQQAELCSIASSEGGKAAWNAFPVFEQSGVGVFTVDDFTDNDMEEMLGEPGNSVCPK